MFMSKLGLALMVSAALFGCSPSSNLLAPKPDAAKPKQEVDRTDSFRTGRLDPRVDILFVVDDSASMAAHQTRLASNIQLFTRELANQKLSDVHIGVVTTSMDNNSRCGAGSFRAYGDGRLVNWKSGVSYVTPKTPNFANVLAQNIMVGTSGSAEEMSFDPVMAAIGPDLALKENKGFYRQGAALAVIFVTDAEDQSNIITSGQDFYDRLLAEKDGDPERVIGYGVLVPSNNVLNCAKTDDWPPVRTEEFLKLTNGIEFSLCAPDYGTKLAEVAKDLAQRVGQYIYLSTRPDVSTITVSFGSQIIPADDESGWIYDPQRNAIRFGPKLIISKQDPSTRLKVDYLEGAIK